MLSYIAALDIIEAAATPARVILAEPAAMAGAVAAGPVRSALAVPSFDNAAMDGFALDSAACTAASPGAPVRLTLAGSIVAGQSPPASTPAGSAWEIATGAPLPAGCDAVVPVERAERLPGEPPAILVREPLAPGQNRRAAGEDFAPGDLLVDAGAVLGPPAVMALCATGHDRVTLRAPPRVAVITTGGELAASGRPDASGRIRDVNGPYLATALAALGLPLAAWRHVGDEPAALRATLAEVAGDCDIVITTGGVSAGRLDFVPAALAEAGAALLFHKVAIRPGKPLLCARLREGPLLFGLPGNPMAVAVGLRFFVLAAVRAMLGRPRETLLPARAAQPIRGRPALTFFAKAVARLSPEAVLEVSLLPGQESFKISPLLRANCWAVVPAGGAEIPAHGIVGVAALLPGEFPAGSPHPAP